jgi:hypothetical protein
MRVRDAYLALRGMVQRDTIEPRTHVKLAGQWLLNAQARGQGGYAHSFSLLSGWLPAYPETTGYIIGTMLNLAKFLHDPAYTASAIKAGEWLLAQQNETGSFNGLSGVPLVFDTGQIITGLLDIHMRVGDPKYLLAAMRAGDWLAENQAADGSWVRHAYLGMPHSYYIKVAAALLRLAHDSGHDLYAEVAKRNWHWTLEQKTGNGFFRRAAFTDTSEPYLHTIVYILEGFLEFQRLAPDRETGKAIEDLSQALLQVERRDGLLYSRYNDQWEPVLRQRCLVGMAQWAAASMECAGLFSNPGYRHSALRNRAFLASKQVRAPGSAITGSLPASLPIWGNYVPFSYINWGVKYFVDALMAADHPDASLLPSQEPLWKTI